MTINKMAEDIRLWREGQGFYTPTSLKAEPTDETKRLGENDAMLGKLMLVSTEISEAAEAVRDADYVNFVEELADACIRIFDIAATVGLDLEGAIKEKMEVNRSRAKKHGRKTNL